MSNAESRRVSRFKKDVKLFLPPEYKTLPGEWEQLFDAYAKEGDGILYVSQLIQLDMQSHWTALDFTEVVATLDNIRFTPDGVLVDMEFSKTKTGLCSLYVAEFTPDIGFIPVLPAQGIKAIQRVAMTRIPA